MATKTYQSVDSEGVPFQSPQPITTPDIEVCGGCGCMELTHPDHHEMFRTKEDLTPPVDVTSA